ncbi:hypothetical protein [Glycomyces sp. NPDC048151]|uniref:hypothetical protein n=1 Tax=Glycomyces sp. NPDC048151 TaxID=3364002 RepID=UPI0037201F04
MSLAWNASELLTGRKFQARRPFVAFKNGKQSYSSTTSLQSDADLKMVLPAGGTYLVEVNFGTTGATAGDITCGWDVTGDATVHRSTQAMTLAGTTSSDTTVISCKQSTSAWASGTALTPAPCAVREKLVVVTGNQPSTLTLRWAQNTSSTTATSVTDYGWAVAHRLD